MEIKISSSPKPVETDQYSSAAQTELAIQPATQVSPSGFAIQSEGLVTQQNGHALPTALLNNAIQVEMAVPQANLTGPTTVQMIQQPAIELPSLEGCDYPDFNKLRMQQRLLGDAAVPTGSNGTTVQPSNTKIAILQPGPDAIQIGGCEYPAANQVPFQQLMFQAPAQMKTIDEPARTPDFGFFNEDVLQPVADGPEKTMNTDTNFGSNAPEQKDGPQRKGLFGETLHDPATCKKCNDPKANDLKDNANVKGLEFILNQTVGKGIGPTIEKKVFLSLYYGPGWAKDLYEFLKDPISDETKLRAAIGTLVIRLRDDRKRLEREERALEELLKQRQEALDKLEKVQKEHRERLENHKKWVEETNEKLKNATPNGTSTVTPNYDWLRKLEEEYFARLKEIDEELRRTRSKIDETEKKITELREQISETEKKLGLNEKLQEPVEQDR